MSEYHWIPWLTEWLWSRGRCVQYTFCVKEFYYACSVQCDPDLYHTRKKLLQAAAQKLEQYEMIRYDQRSGAFFSTDLGRTASHFYVKSDTIEVRIFLLWSWDWYDFLQTLLHGDGPFKMTDFMSVENVLAVISGASEFHQLKVRWITRTLYFLSCCPFWLSAYTIGPEEGKCLKSVLAERRRARGTGRISR